MWNNFNFLINESLVQIFLGSLLCMIIFNIILKNYKSGIIISISYTLVLLLSIPNVQETIFAGTTISIIIVATLFFTHYLTEEGQEHSQVGSHILINYIIYYLIHVFLM